jgi:hypothetical protein
MYLPPKNFCMSIVFVYTVKNFYLREYRTNYYTTATLNYNKYAYAFSSLSHKTISINPSYGAHIWMSYSYLRVRDKFLTQGYYFIIVCYNLNYIDLFFLFAIHIYFKNRITLSGLILVYF